MSVRPRGPLPGWQPRTDLESLIAMMVDADMERVAKE